MCIYYTVTNLCGHPSVIAGPSCELIFDQLQRINDPINHYWPLSERYHFNIPDGCLPNAKNIRPMPHPRLLHPDQYAASGLGSSLYCSVECRNNSVHGKRTGEPDAEYGPGSERWRIGIGWRQHSGEVLESMILSDSAERDNSCSEKLSDADANWEDGPAWHGSDQRVGKSLDNGEWVKSLDGENWMWGDDVMGTLAALKNGEMGEDSWADKTWQIAEPDSALHLVADGRIRSNMDWQGALPDSLVNYLPLADSKDSFF